MSAMLPASNSALYFKSSRPGKWLDSKVRAADPRRLGATVTPTGTDFAIWAPAADAVEVCLFGEGGEVRFSLTHRDGPVWHGHLSGVREGQPYGYRIHGPWQPDSGWRFNPAKLLIDPYTHLLSGAITSAPEVFGHYSDDAYGNGALEQRDDRDSANFVPLSVVTNHGARQIERPNTPWSTTVIYEAHTRGLTARNQAIPESERGTFAALGDDSVIRYLQRLGVTALELLPIHHFLSETRLRGRGRSNHWGYNPIAFSAPHRSYAATSDPIGELQRSIDSLHQAGIEVILDVVYNHTAEEGLSGPTLSFKGIDNKTFYRHNENGQYEDFTGCGNTIDTRRPFVTRMIIDSLHWWSEVIGVDGFRFDLTTAISRSDSSIDTYGPLISAICADPILRERKLIAEPWDVSGYALGEFPYPWREWNDAYRDATRQFWLADSARGHSNGVSDFASRIAGSNDIFYFRGPTSSINFVTAHDGFTLSDLVSYESKHNEANGEDNRDGSDNNRSWNLGVEGPTLETSIVRNRERLKRSILATLLLSSGVPMINMGDESSRSQFGSNNAYSLDLGQPWDSEGNFYGGWALDWENSQPQSEMLDVVAALTSIRAKYLVVDEFFTGALDQGTKRKDLAWFNQEGLEMTGHTWQDSSRRHLSFIFEATQRQGLYLVMNAHGSEQEFILPNQNWGESFRMIFDSSVPPAELSPLLAGPSDSIRVGAFCVQIWLANRIKT